uniref:Uncharacterized protein n=1 Tax=Grammatophora oceanica TaxID=210454 RepID=A0A7S1V7M3_9STRA|mmetsp:Transcript_38848/g.57771  ORF Transcript_38848/g.57771 Transcript_38848/m.57771 type:complete len:108 (+) Transcript_38848:73-396(+)
MPTHYYYNRQEERSGLSEASKKADHDKEQVFFGRCGVGFLLSSPPHSYYRRPIPPIHAYYYSSNSNSQTTMGSLPKGRPLLETPNNRKAVDFFFFEILAVVVAVANV